MNKLFNQLFKLDQVKVVTSYKYKECIVGPSIK